MIDREADKEKENPFDALGLPHFKLAKFHVLSKKADNKKNNNGRIMDPEAMKRAMEQFERETQMGKPYEGVSHKDKNNQTEE